MYEGYQWRQREEWRRQAWFTAHIINAAGRLKRARQPRDLLPREMREEKRQTVEEIMRELAEREARFNAARKARKARISDSRSQISKTRSRNLKSEIAKR